MTLLAIYKSLKSWLYIYIIRETETPQKGFGSVLPRHNPDYNKFHLESTHKADFTPPDPNYIPVPVSMTFMWSSPKSIQTVSYCGT